MVKMVRWAQDGQVFDSASGFDSMKRCQSKGGLVALDDKDLKKIGEVVETKISGVETKISGLDTKVGGLETKMTKGFGLLMLEMNQRFDQTDQKIDSNHKEVLGKIGEIKKMETKDIQALAGDITIIKKKIGLKAA